MHASGQEKHHGISYVHETIAKSMKPSPNLSEPVLLHNEQSIVVVSMPLPNWLVGCDMLSLNLGLQPAAS